jgi:ubiquinone/menaquinone biosynthesis C-methylase UbiE
MHIPEIEKAMSELSRVLKPEGMLIVNENNMSSVQSIIARTFPFFSGDPHKVIIKKTSAGVEHIPMNAPDRVFTREANIDWLISVFKRNHLELKKRFAGEFTDVYIKVSSKAGKSLIHFFNNFWFSCIKLPQCAEGNILFFQKKKPGE